MQKRICLKCGTFTYVEKHHILPKNIFGIGKTVYLCPNCHRYYHYEILGAKNIKNPDANFHLETFQRWIQGLIVVIAGIGLIYLFFSLFQNNTKANKHNATKTEMSAQQ